MRAWIARDTLDSELFHILDSAGKGYSLTEILWETSESQWFPARLVWRDPRWFSFDPADGRTPMLLSEQGRPEPLGPFKFIYHVHTDKSGLPVRGGLARPGRAVGITCSRTSR